MGIDVGFVGARLAGDRGLGRRGDHDRTFGILARDAGERGRAPALLADLAQHDGVHLREVELVRFLVDGRGEAGRKLLRGNHEATILRQLADERDAALGRVLAFDVQVEHERGCREIDVLDAVATQLDGATVGLVAAVTRDRHIGLRERAAARNGLLLRRAHGHERRAAVRRFVGRDAAQREPALWRAFVRVGIAHHVEHAAAVAAQLVDALLGRDPRAGLFAERVHDAGVSRLRAIAATAAAEHELERLGRAAGLRACERLGDRRRAHAGTRRFRGFRARFDAQPVRQARTRPQLVGAARATARIEDAIGDRAGLVGRTARALFDRSEERIAAVVGLHDGGHRIRCAVADLDECAGCFARRDVLALRVRRVRFGGSVRVDPIRNSA